MMKVQGVGARLVSYSVSAETREEAIEAGKQLAGQVRKKEGHNHSKLIDVVRKDKNSYRVIIGWGHMANRWISMRRKSSSSNRGYQNRNKWMW